MSDVLSAAPGIAPGRQIGKYQILQHMATGGMAEIYLARATGIERFQKLVVIKRILPAHAQNVDIRTMLLDEARIAATLHHGNIVGVFDIGEAGGDYFYCMEYLHGRDVSSVVTAARERGHFLSEDQAFSIVLAVCSGLHYAHEKTDEQDRPLGIVHRDVSPTNVFVTYDGGVKLLDFGLVQATGRATESRSGALKGKLAYMSPEQCRAKQCDRRADIFALSILLWELTTGRRLFEGECDFDFLTAILEKDIPTPSSVVPGYPRELERIVMRGLARDPADRYQTAEAMQLELEEYARDRKLRVSPITLRQLMEQLFADDLAEWHAARRSGVALEDHILEQVPLAVGSVSVVAKGSQSQFAPTARPMSTKLPTVTARSRAPWLVALAALLLGAGALVYVVFGRGSDDPRTRPAETKETKPADMKLGDTKAGDTKTGDPKVDTKAGETKAGETKAGETKAGETKAADPKAGETKAGETKAGDPKAGDPTVETKTGDPKAGDPKAGDPKAGDPTVETKAGDPKAGDPKAGAKADTKAGDPKANDTTADTETKPGKKPVKPAVKPGVTKPAKPDHDSLFPQ